MKRIYALLVVLAGCASTDRAVVRAEPPTPARASTPISNPTSKLPAQFLAKYKLEPTGPFQDTPVSCRAPTLSPEIERRMVVCQGVVSGYELAYLLDYNRYSGNTVQREYLGVRLNQGQSVWYRWHQLTGPSHGYNSPFVDWVTEYRGAEKLLPSSGSETDTQIFRGLRELLDAAANSPEVIPDDQGQERFYGLLRQIEEQKFPPLPAGTTLADQQAAAGALEQVDCDQDYFEVGRVRYFFVEDAREYTRVEADQVLAQANARKVCELDGWTLLEARDRKAISRICTQVEDVRFHSACACAWTSGEVAGEAGKRPQAILKTFSKGQPRGWELQPKSQTFTCGLVLKGPAPPPKAKPKK